MIKLIEMKILVLNPWSEHSCIEFLPFKKVNFQVNFYDLQN